MKTKQKLPIADCPPSAVLRRTGRLPIESGDATSRLSSIVNRKSQIVNVPAFTLIELLTVIAVIAVIASLIFPVAKTVKRQAFLHNAQAQMSQLETAMERYKSAYGFYPPGSMATVSNVPTTQLYYELAGTVRTNIGGVDSYVTLDGSTTITTNNLISAFGVAGFVNCNKPGGDESALRAQNFLPDLNTNQFSPAVVSNIPVKLLVTPIGGPDTGYNPLGQANNWGVNPWRYVYPGTNNPASYDLWMQLEISGNTNLICNWTKSVQINNGSVP